jgi:hypothetical protein
MAGWAPTPACPAYAEAASRRQAKRGHFGVQARTMKMIANNELHDSFLFGNQKKRPLATPNEARGRSSFVGGESNYFFFRVMSPLAPFQ